MKNNKFGLLTTLICLATVVTLTSCTTVEKEVLATTVEALPVFEYDTISTYGFDGDIAPWGVANDSGSQPEMLLGVAESGALMFNMEWSDVASDDRWSDSVRVKADSVDLDANGANAVAYDLYLESGKTISAPFDIVTILQFPPTWWVEGSVRNINYSNGTDLGNGLVKYSIISEINGLVGDEVISHLLINVVGNGSGYQGKVLIDNISLVTTK